MRAVALHRRAGKIRLPLSLICGNEQVAGDIVRKGNTAGSRNGGIDVSRRSEQLDGRDHLRA